MSINLLCNDQQSYTVPSEWIDRWELLSNIRDEIGIEQVVVVPYSREQLEPWVQFNYHTSLIEVKCQLITDRTIISERDAYISVNDGYSQPSTELYRFFLPSSFSLLMKVNTTQSVENRIEEYEKIGRELRKRGIPWSYMLDLKETCSFHQNLCVSSDLAIYPDKYGEYKSNLTREELLNIDHLNLFMGIAHDAYLSFPCKKVLVWHCIDWEALKVVCIKYSRTPKEIYLILNTVPRVKIAAVSLEYNKHFVGLCDVLTGGKYEGMLPYSSFYNIQVLREESRPLELINLIYSGYTFKSTYCIESHGLNAVLRKPTIVVDRIFEDTLAWMNYIVLKECSDKIGDQVDTLGEYFGTAAMMNYKKMFEHHIAVWKGTGVCVQDRCEAFIVEVDKWLIKHPNQLPTKIPDEDE